MNICPRCRSPRSYSAGRVTSVPWRICRNCDFAGEAEEFRRQTVFMKITGTPKALAPHFVYRKWNALKGYSDWHSTIIKDNPIPFRNEAEAIAATIKELEKVIK